VLVSAVTGEGLDALGDRIEQWFRGTLRGIELLVPYRDAGKLAELHDVAGDTLEREEGVDGIHVRARVPAVVADRFAPYAVAPAVVLEVPAAAAATAPAEAAAAADDAGSRVA
jgi:GTP-binding protein HflX